MGSVMRWLHHSAHEVHESHSYVMTTLEVGIMGSLLGALCPEHGTAEQLLTSADGLISVMINHPECVYYIDARFGYAPAVMKHVLHVADIMGIEPMSDDEVEPEMLDDGTVRIYCASTYRSTHAIEGPCTCL